METKLTFCDWLKIYQTMTYIKIIAKSEPFIFPTWTQKELDNMHKVNA